MKSMLISYLVCSIISLNPNYALAGDAYVHESAPDRMPKVDPPGPTPVDPPLPLISVPSSVKADPGEFVLIKPITIGKVVKWRLTKGANKGLTLFPQELLQDKRIFVATAKNVPGDYVVQFWTAVGDQPSDLAECVVTISGVVPPTPIPVPPGPTPGPVPPTPGPTPPTPTPTPPAPIGSPGKRVLMIYETADSAKMPEKQQQVLYGSAIRDYMDSKCEPNESGKGHAWRIYDKDVDLTGESKIWQEAMKRPKASVPWIIISNGTTGYEGPLPASQDEAITLLKKYLD